MNVDDICMELTRSRIKLPRIENTASSLLEQLPAILNDYVLYRMDSNDVAKDKIMSITGDKGLELGNKIF